MARDIVAEIKEQIDQDVADLQNNVKFEAFIQRINNTQS